MDAVRHVRVVRHFDVPIERVGFVVFKTVDVSATIYILIDGILGKFGELNVCGVGNSQSASLTGFLGGNQDGAVGCVRTIKCGSVGSFQNNDVFIK